MLSIEECRKLLKDFDLSDEEVVKLRGFLYGIIKRLLENGRKI